MDMPCIMGICGTYIYSSLLISSMFIGKFLILFFSVAYFSVSVDGHPTSCWSILVSYAPLISRWWKYALLLSTVFRKV